MKQVRRNPLLTAIEILRILRDMPRLTPILIGKKIGRPPSVVRNVLVILVELRLVTPAARGLYELNPSGEELLGRIEEVAKGAQLGLRLRLAET